MTSYIDVKNLSKNFEAINAVKELEQAVGKWYFTYASKGINASIN